MAKPDIFVPYGIKGKKEYSLYTIESTETPYTDESWLFYEENQDKDIITDKANAKLWELQNYFGEHGKGREFALLLRGREQSAAKIHDGTLSVFLGLYLTVKQQIENLPFNAGWASITVTGDLEIRDGNLLLKSVGDLEKKYEGFKQEIKEYIQSDNDKHLFLYVSDTPIPEDEDKDDHIYIERFPSQDSIDSVVRYVFNHWQDANQKRLYNSMVNRRGKAKNIDYIKTKNYRWLEKEALSPKWHGFFIQGEGDSGKSALAEALAEYLFRRNEIYAPLWITVENASIRKPQDENITQECIIEDYLTAFINEQLGNTGEQSLPQVLSEKKYLIVFDNFEFDNIAEILTAIEKITTVPDINNRPRLIITSRVGVREGRSKLQEMGISATSVPELDKTDIEKFVAEINKNDKDLGDLSQKPGYAEFIQALYDNFRSYPGLILVAVNPLQDGRTMLDLLPDLQSMRSDDIETKALKIYRTAFSTLDEFTQSVLFILINLISPDILTTEDKLVEAVKAMGYAKSNLRIEEKVVKALKVLEDKFIIYHEKGTSRYGMKGIAFLTFMFGDIFQKKPDTVEAAGKNPREIVAKTHILQMALRYDRSEEIINELIAAINDPLETGLIFYQEAMIRRPREYIDESVKYYEQALNNAEPGSERYIKASRGYLQTLNIVAMIHASWDQLDAFLDRLSKENLDDWQLQVQIGDAYYNKAYYIERIGKYFELADTAYQKALDLCTPETDLETIRTISISKALNLSTWSDAAENKMDLLDQALMILTNERIFSGCTREKFPVLYADRARVLGDIYDRRFLCKGQKEDVEKAIVSVKNAKDTYSKKKEPVKYGRACNSLSLAYLDAAGASSTDQELDQNRSLAMEACKEELAVFTKNDFPVYYAAAQNHLGNIYKSLLRKQNDAELFEKAIAAFQEAQKIYQTKNYYFWNGRVQHNMADLYFKRGDNEFLIDEKKIAYFREAIKLFENSIEYRKKYPKYYVGTLLQLGRTCIDLAKMHAIGKTEKKDILEKAVKRLDEGISLCPDDEKRNKRRLFWNKGLALEKLFLLTGKKDFIKDGIEHIKEGIKYTDANSEDRPRMEKDLQQLEGYNL
jgi:tetratricopeptide (TPR) repeat protein